MTRGAAEGVVIHSSDGRTFKVKPEISIDAAVIGYIGTEHGVSEMLLALSTPSGRYQTIGRVRTGWSRRECKELAAHLTARTCASAPVTDRPPRSNSEKSPIPASSLPLLDSPATSSRKTNKLRTKNLPTV